MDSFYDLDNLEDKDFLPIQLGEDPATIVMIGFYLPDKVKEKLTDCLLEPANLCTCNTTDMPGILPDIDFHHMVVNPKGKWVESRRSSRIDEKSKVVVKSMEDFIKVDFLNDVKYVHRLDLRLFNLEQVSSKLEL